MASFCPLSAGSGRMSPAGKCDPATWIPLATGLRHSAVSGFARVPSFPSCWHLDIRASGAATLQLCYGRLSDMQTHTHWGGSQLTSRFHSLSDLGSLVPPAANLVSPDTRVSFPLRRQGPPAPSLSPGAVLRTLAQRTELFAWKIV